MELSLSNFLRDWDWRRTLASLASASQSRSDHHSSSSGHDIQKRGLAPSDLVLAIVVPVALVGIATAAATIVILRRKRRRTKHGAASSSAAAIRVSIEEDIESYRLERERLGGKTASVGPAGIAQDDLEKQLRAHNDSRMSLSSILTGGTMSMGRNSHIGAGGAAAGGGVVGVAGGSSVWGGVGGGYEGQGQSDGDAETGWLSPAPAQGAPRSPRSGGRNSGVMHGSRNGSPMPYGQPTSKPSSLRNSFNPKEGGQSSADGDVVPSNSPLRESQYGFAL